MIYEQKHKILVDYLHSKVDEADWHGVCEAANDLRVMEAKRRIHTEREEVEKNKIKEAIEANKRIIRDSQQQGIGVAAGQGLVGSVLSHPDNRSGQLEDAVTKYRYSPPVPDPFEI